MKSHRANRCYPDAFILQDLNRCSEFQCTLLGHFFNFSTTAVKRWSTFHGILVLLSFNASIIMKSHQGQQVLSRCFHCARLESMYWNSVYTFGALLEFQYHSCEEIIYFSWYFSTTFIQCIHHNEVTSGQQVLYRCCHCARLESMYLNSVSTFGPLLQFQYHSCEEIVYFSRDFSTTFIQYIKHSEVTSGQQVL